ncbi:uncharacterized protein LOC121390236 [Gigantopelta aegis]|uniref:uncharacterized protein LOC121390236 n=1 Tax=Gigantopelta aegis TaxID=1735272 RepID=UPI001B88AD28|nr:uncharacterized protein LOC121390236 [Gigantopelta aegis]
MKALILVLFAASVLQCLCGLDISLRHGYWKQMHDLNDINMENPLHQYSGITSKMDCSRLCLNHASCLAYSLRQQSAVCRVYSQYTWGGLTWIGYQTYWKMYDHCSNNYTLIETAGVCVRLYDSPQSWALAEQTCIQDGGHLFIIDSQLRRDVLRAFIQVNGNLTNQYYIGSKKNGLTYAWINGVQVDSFWHVNAQQSADYVLCQDYLGSLHLVDSSGTSAESFVCELPILNL